MIIIAFIIFLTLTIIGAYRFWEATGIFGVLTILFGIALGSSIISIPRMSSIKAERDMLIEENKQIENSLYEVLSTLEDGTKYDKENILYYVSLHPELSQNEFVIKQIEKHSQNTITIQKQNQEIADINIMKWWLYFGK